MNDDTQPHLPTELEEWLNSLSHGLGAVLSVVGTVVLVTLAAALGDPWKIVGFVIFGLSLFVLYLVSTIYHSVRDPGLKSLFKTLDHCAIFLLIAGSYTPFLIVNMRSSSGIALLVAIWTLALAGTLLKLRYANRFKLARLAVYLLMGWLILFALGDFVASVNSAGVWLLFGGGVAYTLGIVFYLGHRIPFNHAIWHLFVLTGSICHYFAMVYAVLPYPAA